MESSNLDEVRGLSLARIQRTERNFRLAFFAAVALEGLLLVTFLLLMEPQNRLHVLLLVATVGSYSVVVLGLVALGAHVNRGNLRLLRAVELLRETAPKPG